MSFGDSHWCRPTPRDEHRPMEIDEYRSTFDTKHQSTEEVASYAAVRILSHEEFATKHPHPPKPLCIKKSDIDWHHGKLPMDRQTQPTIDTTTPASIDDHLLHTESAATKDRCSTPECT
ncbi:hypothetical protein F2Q69_00007116 [Brassica cretica]|uniref:Uncharacterized protein n=1 Tax=Brassica cretica TaxID=69181 RepID=A0A8S9PHG4_BRACR|nr:hypothetical protein F2Q69_00042803 [Brassica cretica]KAF3512273.1 hypothetical protein F2Q69_00007116 [Brassica cretica]